MGVLLVLGGILTALNQRTSGPIFIIMAVIMMIATQDNPWIRDQVKPKPKGHIRMNDFFRHLSLIGACLFVIVVPPDDEEEDSDKKVKSD